MDTACRLTCHQWRGAQERLLIEWHPTWERLIESLMAHFSESWDSWTITLLPVEGPGGAEGEGGAG
jgi:hypothetical protein